MNRILKCTKRWLAFALVLGLVFTSSVSGWAASAVQIVAQPDDVTADVGDKVTFTVKAEGEGLTYQWEFRTTETGSWKSSGATGNKTDTLTVSTVAKFNGYQYRCVVYDAAGNHAKSNEATLTIGKADEAPVLKITGQPADATAEVGEKVKFSVKAEGEGLTYQWEYRTTATGSWKNSGATGNKSATLTVTTAAKFDGYEYRCAVKDASGNTMKSNAATLTVGKAEETPVLKITGQPSDATAEVGEKVKFSVKAEGEGLTYQWEYRTSKTGSWKNSGATGNKTATLTVSTVAKFNGYQYRCVVYDAAGNHAKSNEATLTIGKADEAPVLKITGQPSDATAEVGEKVKFSVKAEGEGLTYQWEYRTTETGSWKNSGATGNKSATLTVTTAAKFDGYEYRCAVKDASGNTMKSSAATLTVGKADEAPVLKITGQPADATAEVGEKVKFNVKAEGEGLTYQWEYRTTATGSWKNSGATGNKSATLTVSSVAKFDGYQYRCVVNDAAGNHLKSNAATLTVKAAAPVLAITSQPADVTAAVGEKVKFSVKAEGEGLTYQWEYRTTATGSWKNSGATGNKTATLTVSAVEKFDGYDYRCKVTDQSGAVVYSKAAALTIAKEQLIDKANRINLLKYMTEDVDLDATVTRLEMARLIAALDNLRLPSEFNLDFEDCKNLSEQDQKILVANIEAEYLAGRQDGTFAPNGSVSRAELAVIFDKIYEICGGVQRDKYLNDVTWDQWYFEEVLSFYNLGIIEVEGNNFNNGPIIMRDALQWMVNAREWDTADHVAATDTWQAVASEYVHAKVCTHCGWWMHIDDHVWNDGIISADGTEITQTCITCGYEWISEYVPETSTITWEEPGLLTWEPVDDVFYYRVYVMDGSKQVMVHYPGNQNSQNMKSYVNEMSAAEDATYDIVVKAYDTDYAQIGEDQVLRKAIRLNVEGTAVDMDLEVSGEHDYIITLGDKTPVGKKMRYHVTWTCADNSDCHDRSYQTQSNGPIILAGTRYYSFAEGDQVQVRVQTGDEVIGNTWNITATPTASLIYTPGGNDSPDEIPEGVIVTGDYPVRNMHFEGMNLVWERPANLANDVWPRYTILTSDDEGVTWETLSGTSHLSNGMIWGSKGEHQLKVVTEIDGEECGSVQGYQLNIQYGGTLEDGEIKAEVEKITTLPSGEDHYRYTVSGFDPDVVPAYIFSIRDENGKSVVTEVNFSEELYGTIQKTGLDEVVSNGEYRIFTFEDVSVSENGTQMDCTYYITEGTFEEKAVYALITDAAKYYNADDELVWEVELLIDGENRVMYTTSIDVTLPKEDALVELKFDGDDICEFKAVPATVTMVVERVLAGSYIQGEDTDQIDVSEDIYVYLLNEDGEFEVGKMKRIPVGSTALLYELGGKAGIDVIIYME